MRRRFRTRKKLLTPAEKKERFTQAVYSFAMVIAWTAVLAIFIKWKMDQDAKFNKQNVELKSKHR